MASSSLPVTPERFSVTRNPIRRSFTVPPKLATPNKQPQIGAAADIETLCVHPSAKVVSFSTSSTGSPRPSSARSNASPVGVLPWRTSTERTLAAGPLEVYRVPGSVAFLRSGPLLHAILARSQCWCVDGVSVFVFRVLPEQYYRIELPGETEEDRALVEEFKITLQKVLQYEKTACPFNRGFTVDLPQTPDRPSRRQSRIQTEPVKKWRLDGVWRPEDWKPDSPQDVGSLRSRQNSVETSPVRTSEVEPESPSPSPQPSSQDDNESEAESPDIQLPRPKAFASMRSVTAPSKLNLQHLPVDERLPVTDLDGAMHGSTFAQQANEIVEQLASMPPRPYSPPKTPKPLTPTKEQTRLEAEAEKTPVHALPMPTTQHAVDEEGLESASTDDTDGLHLSEDDMVERRVMFKPSTLTTNPDPEYPSWKDAVIPPETIRLRHPEKANPQLNPSDISAAPRPFNTKIHRTSSRDSQARAAAANAGLVRKTYTILTSPPSYLVNIMLRMASNIASGALNLTIPSPVGAPKRVPGSWFLQDDEDDWDLDGYGFALRSDSRPRSASPALRNSNVCDVD